MKSGTHLFVFLTLFSWHASLQSAEDMQLRPVSEVLGDSAHPCHALLAKLHERVGRFEGASAIVMGLASPKRGLLLTRRHGAVDDLLKNANEWDVFREGVKEKRKAPPPVSTYFSYPKDGTPGFNTLAALLGNRPEEKLERAQLLMMGKSIREPEKKSSDLDYQVWSLHIDSDTSIPPHIREPLRITPPRVGEGVIVVGYDIRTHVKQASLGNVVSETPDAEDDIPALVSADDLLPNHKLFIVNARAVKGFSGGGIFNLAGELLGVTVSGFFGNTMTVGIRADYIARRVREELGFRPRREWKTLSTLYTEALLPDKPRGMWFWP